MKFCSHCGKPVVFKIPPGDSLHRYLCESCGRIHYQNPRMVVGCVPQRGGRILLCKRAIEPRLGYWTVPAGFMENGETMEAGAAREAKEEALAEVRIGGLIALVNVPHVNQVHIMFRADLLNEDFGVGAESLEVALVGLDEIPWESLAFPSVTFTLQRYLEDLNAGKAGVHVTQVARLRG